jgi:hypothetical protein
MFVTLELWGKSPDTIMLEAVWLPVSVWTIWVGEEKEKLII